HRRHWLRAAADGCRVRQYGPDPAPESARHELWSTADGQSPASYAFAKPDSGRPGCAVRNGYPATPWPRPESAPADSSATPGRWRYAASRHRTVLVPARPPGSPAPGADA